MLCLKQLDVSVRLFRVPVQFYVQYRFQMSVEAYIRVSDFGLPFWLLLLFCDQAYVSLISTTHVNCESTRWSFYSAFYGMSPRRYICIAKKLLGVQCFFPKAPTNRHEDGARTPEDALTSHAVESGRSAICYLRM